MSARDDEQVALREYHDTVCISVHGAASEGDFTEAILCLIISGEGVGVT